MKFWRCGIGVLGIRKARTPHMAESDFESYAVLPTNQEAARVSALANLIDTLANARLDTLGELLERQSTFYVSDRPGNGRLNPLDSPLNRWNEIRDVSLPAWGPAGCLDRQPLLSPGEHEVNRRECSQAGPS